MYETKSSTLANQCRIEGNLHYKERDFEMAIESYNSCILNSCFASDSYVKCLGNKSAVLFEMHEYDKAATVIQFIKSLDYDFEKDYSEKLDKRLAACMAKTQNVVSSVQDGVEVNSLFGSRKISTITESGMGRSVVASESFVPNEKVLCVEPFAAVLGYDSWSTYCYTCFIYNADSIIVPCEGCPEVQYCSLKCRNDDKVHQTVECQQIDEIKDLGLMHLTIRVLYKISNESAMFINSQLELDLKEVSSQLPLDSPEKDVLELHQISKVKSVLLEESLDSPAKIVKSFPQFSTTNLDKIEVLLATVTSQLVNNASTIINHSLTLGNSPIGSGIYPQIALMNHSCYSNTMCLFNGKVATVKTTQAIPAHQQLFNSYGCDFENHDKAERQERLFSQYDFLCLCQPCKEDWTRDATVRSAVCQACLASISITLSTATCSNCDTSLALILEKMQMLEERYNLAYDLYQKKSYQAACDYLTNTEAGFDVNSFLNMPDALLLDWNDLIKKCLVAMHIVG